MARRQSSCWESCGLPVRQARRWEGRQACPLADLSTSVGTRSGPNAPLRPITSPPTSPAYTSVISSAEHRMHSAVARMPQGGKPGVDLKPMREEPDTATRAAF